MKNNLAPLKSIFDHDDAVKETFPIFFAHLKRASCCFLRDIHFNKWDSVARNAHKAKGSAGSYGFPALVNVLQALELESEGMKRNDVSLKLLSRYCDLMNRIEIGFNGFDDACSIEDQYETC